MKKMLAVSLVALLSGCASLSTIDGGHPVNCSARLKSATFGMGDYYQVHIDRMKTDHNGTEWVRPTGNLDIQISGWQHKDTFYDYQCEPEGAH